MNAIPSNPAPAAPVDPAAPPAPAPAPAPNAPAAPQKAVPPAPNGPIPTSDPNNPPIQPYTWDGADDELKTFVGTKSPLDVAKELKNAQSMLGKKTIGIPGENSTPEEQQAFHKARGVPESVDGYKFDDVIAEVMKDVPKELAEIDPEREKRYRELFKNSNVSNGEARELLRREMSREIGELKQKAETARQLTQQTNDLVTQAWGNKREEKTQDANNFFRHLGIDDDALKVVNGALGTKPEARMKFLELAASQGASLREGGQPGAGGGLVPGAMTPDQARMAKEQYLAQGDNRDAYLNPQHRNHEAVSKQVYEYAKVQRGVK